MFQQGTELEQAGNYAAALLAFREVGQVRMTPQVQFHIAACEEKLGRLAAALGGFTLALEDASSVGPEFQLELETRIDALKQRIPKLVLERGAGAEAATVELDGIALGGSSIGAEVPLDPGPHMLQAKAPGYKPLRLTIELAEKEVKAVTLELEPVRLGPKPKPKPAEPEPREHEAAPESNRAPRGQARTLQYVIGGVGAIALINAGVFYLLRRGKDSDLQELCGSDRDCTNADPRPLVGDEVGRSRDMYNHMKTDSTVMSVSAVTGLLALGAAGTWYFLDTKQQHASTAWTMHTAAPGADLAGLSLSKHF
jgi:hypothetical protein